MNQAGLETQSIADPLTVPQPSTVEKKVSSKIEKLVSEITQLNLIEVSDLSEVLKKRLNLPDAPMMPVGGFAMGGASVEEEEAATPTKVHLIDGTD